MIFKNKTNGQVASIVDKDLIKQFSEDTNWEIGTEEDLPKQEIIEHKLSYGEIVENKIRQKYTLSQEIAIIRQKDTKPVEWQEYFKYCEQCKQEARQEARQEEGI